MRDRGRDRLMRNFWHKEDTLMREVERAKSTIISALENQEK
ncbi:MAG: hypothetical protein QNJ54_16210 [Prochloraceae cyanobacterium]|nr:hypothetical protein [Prochloraceae cyanobacterium]